MASMTMTNTAVYKKDSEHRRLSLMERFKKYMEENGAEIACGFLALNGGSNAYKLYTQLKNAR